MAPRPSPKEAALEKLIELQTLSREDWLEVADQDEDDNSFDETVLAEFETAWSQFLRENPSALFTTGREQRISELQKEADKVLRSQEKMESEFKTQIAFFQWGQEMAEKKFTTKIHETLERQQKGRELLAEKIQALDKIERIHEETRPWFHFMQELDRLVEEQEPSSSSKDPASRKVAHPSARALLLARTGRNKHSKDKFDWRASRIENALLTAHTSMLHKEIERYETMLAVNEEVGQFLTDLDIGTILKGNEGSAIPGSPDDHHIRK